MSEEIVRRIPRIFAIFVVVIMTLSFTLLGPSSVKAKEDKTVEEEILDILMDRGAIPSEKYNELKKSLEKEKDKNGIVLYPYYKDGFFLEAPEKEFRIRIGGRVQLDYYSFDHNGQDASSSFTMKRARMFLAGTLYKKLDFKVELNFGEGKDAYLADGYINLDYVPYAQIKIGQFKEPFGLEILTSFKYVDFVERSIISTQISPSRDIGIMVHADPFRGFMGYGLGIFNGNGPNKEWDENNDKDIAGRIYLRPFLNTKGTLLKGLQLGGKFTLGEHEGSVKNIMVPTSERTIVGWAAGVKSDDNIWRVGAELAWALGPFSLKGEWMEMHWDGLELNNMREDAEVYGWYIGATCLVTGEEKILKKGVFRRVNPGRKFDPVKGSWGAWELAARYESFTVAKNIFDTGYATGTDGVRSSTLGINWYLNNLFRISFSYVNNHFEDEMEELSGEDEEDLFLFRCQVEF